MKVIHALGSPALSIKYSRQGIVPGFLSTQKKLFLKKILIVGLGGLGCPISLYLSKMGVQVTLMDFDKIEIHNIPRQILFDESKINEYKSEVAAKILSDKNTQVQFLATKLSKENVQLIKDYDIILDCTDSIDCRYLLNDSCKEYNIKYICCSVLGWEGQIYCFKKGGACYRCLYLNKKTNITNCDESGVVSTMCGIIGTLTANEVIKCIEDEEYEQYVFFDGKNNDFIKSAIRPPNELCKACYPSTSKEQDIEYNGNLPIVQSNKKDGNVCGSSDISIAGLKFISWKEVAHMNNKQIIILDVRSKDLFNYIKIENSINIPITQLEILSKDEILQILLPNKLYGEQSHNPIYVLCKRGISAQKASFFLKQKGIESKVIRDGLQLYREVDSNFIFF
ncbi:Adenylyltransferase and sulfurtransferase MOCS3 [Cucumispora dikerogammari]|nr:Adenylyltransferase and sulfurtransferase MOCS3 [Cucumispora dikerogammari]